METVGKIEAVQPGIAKAPVNSVQLNAVAEEMQKLEDLKNTGQQGMTAPDARIFNPRVDRRGPQQRPPTK